MDEENAKRVQQLTERISYDMNSMCKIAVKTTSLTTLSLTAKQIAMKINHF